jgi:Mat/Ecp fimbriae outer membrane usher protein
MAIVDLAGAEPDMEFEVMVNESPVGQVRGGDRLPVALTPYREYEVRIRQVGGKLAEYDSDARRLALYPGNVAQLKWDAAALFAVFGRLVGEDGRPISDAVIESATGIGQTDANGYFQIQASAVASISARLPGGQRCEANLPTLRADNGYVRAGTLTCTMTSSGERLRGSTIASSTIERSQ